MGTTLAPPPKSPKKRVFYPSSDGQPMAESTEQYDWLTRIKDNLEVLYKSDPHVFVAGDLLWYPVEGDNKTRLAPDVLVALGRPKGRRGSYRQWREGGAPPQVVFEVLSPGNRAAEMENKFAFYQKYGVEEYYIYDPERLRFTVYLRDVLTGLLQMVNTGGDFISPRLGVRFVQEPGEELEIYHPNGEAFRSLVESDDLLERMREKLRALGIDPDAV